jgi:hypothetical protein
VSWLCNDAPRGNPAVARAPAWDALLARLAGDADAPHVGRSTSWFVTSVVRAALARVADVPPALVAYLLDVILRGDTDITSNATVGLAALIARMRRPERRAVALPPVPPLPAHPPLFVLGSGDVEDEGEDEDEEDEDEHEHDDDDHGVDKHEHDEDEDDVAVFDEPSGGWHRCARRREFPVPDPRDAALCLERLPAVFRALVAQAPEGESADGPGKTPGYDFFWAQVTRVFGGASFDALSPAWEDSFSEPLVEWTAMSLCDYARGVASVLPSLPPADGRRAVSGFFVPLVVLAAQAPQVSEGVMQHLQSFGAAVSPLRLAPVLDFLLANSSGAPESTLVTRNYVDLMTSIIGLRPGSVFTSIDLLFEHYVAPFFADIASYSFSEDTQRTTLFFILLEAAVCPKASPLYAPAVDEKFEWLVARLEDVIARGEPAERRYQEFLSNVLGGLNCGSCCIIEALTGLFVNHMEKVVLALNSTDLVTEDMLFSVIADWLCSVQFANRIDIEIELIRAFVANFGLFSIPMKQGFASELQTLLQITIQAFSKNELFEIYGIFDEMIRKESNVDVQISLVLVLGFIAVFSGQLRDMTEIEAASIIAGALLFDEVDDLVLKAFEMIKNKIEADGWSQTSLWQRVVRMFWTANTEHMMPKVEEVLAPYRFLVFSNYFA